MDPNSLITNTNFSIGFVLEKLRNSGLSKCEPANLDSFESKVRALG
jgi:hypothetical protein